MKILIYALKISFFIVFSEENIYIRYKKLRKDFTPFQIKFNNYKFRAFFNLMKIICMFGI